MFQVEVVKLGESIELIVDNVEQGRIVLPKKSMPVTSPVYIGGIPMTIMTIGGFTAQVIYTPTIQDLNIKI